MSNGTPTSALPPATTESLDTAQDTVPRESTELTGNVNEAPAAGPQPVLAPGTAMPSGNAVERTPAVSATNSAAPRPASTPGKTSRTLAPETSQTEVSSPAETSSQTEAPSPAETSSPADLGQRTESAAQDGQVLPGATKREGPGAAQDVSGESVVSHSEPTASSTGITSGVSRAPVASPPPVASTLPPAAVTPAVTPSPVPVPRDGRAWDDSAVAAQLDKIRNSAPVALVDTVRFDPSALALDPSVGDRTFIRHDVRRMQLPDGRWVRELTLKVRLDGQHPSLPESSRATSEQVADVRHRVLEVVNRRVNGHHVLDNGDLFRVRVDFDSADPHAVVAVRGPDPVPETRSEDGSETRSEDGSLVRSEDGSETRSEDGSEVRSEDGSLVRSEDGSESRSEDGSQTRSEDGSQTRSEDGSQARSEDGSQSATHQLSWGFDDSPGIVLHEVMHYLGAKDEYVDRSMLFRKDAELTVAGPRKENGESSLRSVFRKALEPEFSHDRGVMGQLAQSDDSAPVSRRNVEEIVRIGDGQAVVHDAPHGADPTWRNAHKQPASPAPLDPATVQRELQHAPRPVKEYSHVVVDKYDVGLGQLYTALHQNGLQTAESRGMQLPAGSMSLGHHQHVFMWDTSKRGLDQCAHLLGTPGISALVVNIRWNELHRPGRFHSGTLKGDVRGKKLGGWSTSGAWAYKGDIPRKYMFIEGLDNPNHPGYAQWKAGTGWPDEYLQQVMNPPAEAAQAHTAADEHVEGDLLPPAESLPPAEAVAPAGAVDVTEGTDALALPSPIPSEVSDFDLPSPVAEGVVPSPNGEPAGQAGQAASATPPLFPGQPTPVTPPATGPIGAHRTGIARAPVKGTSQEIGAPRELGKRRRDGAPDRFSQEDWPSGTNPLIRSESKHLRTDDPQTAPGQAWAVEEAAWMRDMGIPRSGTQSTAVNATPVPVAAGPMVEHMEAWQEADTALQQDLKELREQGKEVEWEKVVRAAVVGFKMHNASFVPLDLLSPWPRQISPFDLRHPDYYYRSQRNAPAVLVAQGNSSSKENPGPPPRTDMSYYDSVLKGGRLKAGGELPKTVSTSFFEQIVGARLDTSAMLETRADQIRNSAKKVRWPEEPGLMTVDDRARVTGADGSVFPGTGKDLAGVVEEGISRLLLFPPVGKTVGLAPPGGALPSAEAAVSFVDRRVQQSRALAQELVRRVNGQPLAAVTVSLNGDNPNVTVEITNLREKIEALTAAQVKLANSYHERVVEWLQVYFAASVTTRAAAAGIPLPLQMRQSFGFCDTTVADTAASIRISLGSEPPEFLAVLADGIHDLDRKLPGFLEHIMDVDGSTGVYDGAAWHTAGEIKYAGWYKAVEYVGTELGAFTADPHDSPDGSSLISFAKWRADTKAEHLGNRAAGHLMNDERSINLQERRDRAFEVLQDLVSLPTRPAMVEGILAGTEDIIGQGFGLPIQDDFEDAAMVYHHVLEDFRNKMAATGGTSDFPHSTKFALEGAAVAIDNALEALQGLTQEPPQGSVLAPAQRRALAHLRLRNATEDLLDHAMVLAAANGLYLDRDPDAELTDLVRDRTGNPLATARYTSSGMQAITTASLSIPEASWADARPDNDSYFEVKESLARMLANGDAGNPSTAVRVSDAAPYHAFLDGGTEPVTGGGTVQPPAHALRVLDVTAQGDPVSSVRLQQLVEHQQEVRTVLAASLLKYGQLGADHVSQGVVVDVNPQPGTHEILTPDRGKGTQQFLSMLHDLREVAALSFPPGVRPILPGMFEALFGIQPPGPEASGSEAVFGRAEEILRYFGADEGSIAAWKAIPQDAESHNHYRMLLESTLQGLVPHQGETGSVPGEGVSTTFGEGTQAPAVFDQDPGFLPGFEQGLPGFSQTSDFPMDSSQGTQAPAVFDQDPGFLPGFEQGLPGFSQTSDFPMDSSQGTDILAELDRDFDSVDQGRTGLSEDVAAMSMGSVFTAEPAPGTSLTVPNIGTFTVGPSQGLGNRLVESVVPLLSPQPGGSVVAELYHLVSTSESALEAVANHLGITIQVVGIQDGSPIGYPVVGTRGLTYYVLFFDDHFYPLLPSGRMV
ncbi:MAG: hypothetical protein QG608_292 [Actinomycetota bacterium]|nr:hypothetical protein [Actinomycetota bacterium]